MIIFINIVTAGIVLYVLGSLLISEYFNHKEQFTENMVDRLKGADDAER